MLHHEIEDAGGMVMDNSGNGIKVVMPMSFQDIATVRTIMQKYGFIARVGSTKMQTIDSNRVMVCQYTPMDAPQRPYKW